MRIYITYSVIQYVTLPIWVRDIWTQKKWYDLHRSPLVKFGHISLCELLTQKYERALLRREWVNASEPMLNLLHILK